MEQAAFSVKGISALFLHNAALADPRNKVTIAIRDLTKNIKKTDADLVLISKLEWLGSLYLTSGPDFHITPDGQLVIDNAGEICIPSYVIEASLRDAARKSRTGKVFETSVISQEDNWPLQYDGPKDLNELMEDPEFRDVRPAVVQRAKVMRTRPLFRHWGFDFTMEFDNLDVSKKEIQAAVELAGRKQAIGDFRPRYGRFRIAD